MGFRTLTANNLSAQIEVANYMTRIERARDAAQAEFERLLREDRELSVRMERETTEKNANTFERMWVSLQGRIKYQAGQVNAYNGALCLLYAD